MNAVFFEGCQPSVDNFSEKFKLCGSPNIVPSLFLKPAYRINWWLSTRTGSADSDALSLGANMLTTLLMAPLLYEKAT